MSLTGPTIARDYEPAPRTQIHPTNLVRITTTAALFVDPAAQQHLHRFSVIPRPDAQTAQTRFREVQITLSENQGGTTSARVLWGMIDQQTNRLVAATVMESGGRGRGATPGTHSRDITRSTEGQNLWNTHLRLGSYRLDYAAGGNEGFNPNRRESYFMRHDSTTGRLVAGWSVGIQYGDNCSALDGLNGRGQRSALREHYSGSPNARPTHGCMTASSQGMDVIMNARAYALGVARIPHGPNTNVDDIVAAGRRDFVTLARISNEGSRSTRDQRLAEAIPGYATNLPRTRDILNPNLMNSQAFTAVAEQVPRDPLSQVVHTATHPFRAIFRSTAQEHSSPHQPPLERPPGPRGQPQPDNEYALL